jgi:hypothetical protein
MVGVVGAVRSILISEASMLKAGPRFPARSRTPVGELAPAKRLGIRVPSEQPVTTTSIVVPSKALGSKEQPVASPELSKSVEVISVTLSEKVRV